MIFKIKEEAQNYPIRLQSDTKTFVGLALFSYFCTHSKNHQNKMKNKTYEESMARLEEITKMIEARELTIDELSNNLKEAQQLLKFCKDILYKTEADIQKILDKAGDE